MVIKKLVIPNAIPHLRGVCTRRTMWLKTKNGSCYYLILQWVRAAVFGGVVVSTPKMTLVTCAEICWIALGASFCQTVSGMNKILHLTETAAAS